MLEGLMREEDDKVWAQKQGVTGKREKSLWALPQNTLYVSFVVEHGDDLQRRRVGAVYDGEVGIAGERPKTKRMTG
jgi:hypothetical protein